MSVPTQETIRNLWADSVGQNNSILAFTDKIYTQDLTAEALSQDKKLRYRQDVNFFNFIVRRWVEAHIGQVYTYRFLVDVFYTHEDKPSIDAYNKVLDGLETVETVVRSVLGQRWSGTVDDYSLQQSPPDIAQTTINNVICWRGHSIFTAFKKE